MSYLARVGELLRRPAVGMAIATTGSRATGLFRTVVLASALGVGTLSDAYNVANTAPNMLFTLVAGGTITAAVVPMLSRAASDEERVERASIILGTVALWGVVASAVLALGAPWLMRLLAAGADGERGDELVTLGTRWLRIFAPQVALYGVSVAATSVMTARRRLALGAAAGIATNVVVVGAALAFVVIAGSKPAIGDVSASAVALLGWGTTAGVAAMAALQLWGARRVEPGLRLRPSIRHPAVTELRRRAAWTVLYVAVNQVGYAVVIALAASVAGGVTAYQWAFMLMQLPYAVVGVSILSAAYPSLAEAAAPERARYVAIEAGRGVVLWLAPAVAALALLAVPLATVVVGRSDADLVAAGLVGFAASLVPFTLFQLLTRSSYAAGDARGPAVVNVAVNLVMIAVDVGAMVVIDGDIGRIAGLAAGHAASYVVGCVLLDRRLRVGHRAFVGEVARASQRPALASLALVVVLWSLPVASPDRVTASIWLLVAGVGGAASYLGTLRVTGRLRP